MRITIVGAAIVIVSAVILVRALRIAIANGAGITTPTGHLSGHE